MWKPAGVCALSWANESSLRCEASLLLLPSDIPDLGHQCKRGHWQLAAKPGCVMEVTPFRMGHAQGCIASRRHPSIPQAKFFYLQGFNLILPYRKRKVLLLGPPRRWSDSQIPAVAGGRRSRVGISSQRPFLTHSSQRGGGGPGSCTMSTGAARPCRCKWAHGWSWPGSVSLGLPHICTILFPRKAVLLLLLLLFFPDENFRNLNCMDGSASRQGGSSEEVRRLLISTEEVTVMIEACFQFSVSVLLKKLLAQVHSAMVHKGFVSFWSPGRL